MKTLFQIATGSSVPEEATSFVVENTTSSIEAGIRAAFKDKVDFLGTYKRHKLGECTRFNYYPIDVIYTDTYGDEETLSWQLRPVTVFA